MFVTVFADASFCSQTRSAGYGIWVKTEALSFEHSGRFRSEVVNSSAAETLALANGIWAAIEKAGARPGDIIVAQSDCRHALSAFNRRFNGKLVLSPAERDARDRIWALLDERQLMLRVKHVKGHSDGEGARSWVNGRCDQLARSAMKRERAIRTKHPHSSMQQ